MIITTRIRLCNNRFLCVKVCERRKKVALRNNCILHRAFVYTTQVICNVIGVLRTIAFMGLTRNYPLNHDRLCRFLLRPHIPNVPPCPFCFVTLAISRSFGSRRRIASLPGGNATRRDDFRVFRCTTDNLFVARSRQEWTEPGEEGSFCALLSTKGPPFDTLRLVRRLNETTR